MIFSNADIATADATAILDACKNLYSYGQSKAAAGTAIATLYWPAAIQHNALEVLAQHPDSVSESAYISLARRLAEAVPGTQIPPAVSTGLRKSITAMAAAGDAPDNLAPLVGALCLDEAVRASLAIPNIETGVATAISREPDTQAALRQFTNLLIQERRS